MKKILDYEEMLKFLRELNHEIIQEQEPIGSSEFGEPIRHYTFGFGKEHVILTAGIHSSELISNIFLLQFMKRLSDGLVKIDPQKYTLHFIPIENPDGTIIVTSAIRTLIPKDTNELDEQLTCLQFYLNSVLDDTNASNKNNREDKIIHRMFQYATPNCIDSKYSELRKSVADIIKKNNLPKSCLINWSSNGHGVDLNSNIECGKYLERFLNDEELFAHLRFNQINLFKEGPTGCPSREKGFVEESENTAILKFYKELIDNYNVIGSILFHSCGGIVYYLDEVPEANPWNREYGQKEITYNRAVADAYSKEADYRIEKTSSYTTLCNKLRTFLPGSIVVELGTIRSTPLSQFIDLEINDINFLETSREELKRLSHHYSKTYDKNEAALVKTLEIMSQQYQKYTK